MAGAGHDHVVRRGIDVGQGFTVDTTVGDRGSQVLGRVFAARRGQLGEIGEEVEQDRQLLLRRGATLVVLLVVAAEHLLRELMHPREVFLGQAEQRHDHVEREFDSDLGDEVAFRADVAHPVDVALGQLVDVHLEVAHGLWAEPVRADRAHFAVVRVVHMDQRPQPRPRFQLRLGHIVGRCGGQKGSWLGQEQVVVPLDGHDVGVLGDRPERPVRRVVDPGDGVVRPQTGQRRV